MIKHKRWFSGWFEKAPEREPSKARINMRSRTPSIQEQIKQMMAHAAREQEQFDEDFVGDEYEDSYKSPHELVRDEETGLEMTRYEKIMFDEQKPVFEKNAIKEAMRQFEKKSRSKPPIKSKSPARNSEQSDSASDDAD